MTEDFNFQLRPATGPFKSPEDIVNFYSSIDGWQEYKIYINLLKYLFLSKLVKYNKYLC